jgi:predicted phosphodiesterase
MKTRFIGDIHGKWLEYLNVLHDPKNSCSRSIQVGDFGLGFDERPKYVDEVMNGMSKEGHNHRFIRGNHDNPSACKECPLWIPDGTIEGDVMFVGGAGSIDKDWRNPGIDWWDDEELSYNELGDIIKLYDDTKPKIMVTHDFPGILKFDMFGISPKDGFNTRTDRAFTTMFEIHKPDLWIFGHYHKTKSKVILGTEFMCLGELEWIDLNI